eukprot:91401-Chlamydomonas_euryale.AAC.1
MGMRAAVRCKLDVCIGRITKKASFRGFGRKLVLPRAANAQAAIRLNGHCFASTKLAAAPSVHCHLQAGGPAQPRGALSVPVDRSTECAPTAYGGGGGLLGHEER